MQEKNHLLKILKKVRSCLENKDYVKIKGLSNHVVHSASIEQDPDVIAIAIIIYSLSKLIEREHYKEQKNWPKFYRNYIKSLDNMILFLEKNNIDEFRKEVHSIRNLIKNLTGSLKHYIQDVFRKARINKASRIYEHGISMEKTAKILGISLWELAEYAGQTRIGDQNLGITIPIKQRTKLAMEIFE